MVVKIAWFALGFICGATTLMVGVVLMLNRE